MERIELARFVAEVGQRFQFLVDLYGMEGPESSNLLLPSVSYRRPGLSVVAFLDQGHDVPGRSISVSVSLKAARISRAGLPGLVEVAGFAPAHDVGWKAHTVAAMQRTLDDNAIWLSRLMPVLLGPEVLDLARKGTALMVGATGTRCGGSGRSASPRITATTCRRS
jgi:hypothetical protein